MMSEIIEVKVPDIGDFDAVPTIEVFVKPGDTLSVDDPIVTLESDKANMDVPSPAAGVVKTLHIKPGDKLSEGMLLLTLEAASSDSALARVSMSDPAINSTTPKTNKVSLSAPSTTSDAMTTENTSFSPARPSAPDPFHSPAPMPPLGSRVHASPSVRAYARGLGVDLNRVNPGGPKGRILKEDVTHYVKNILSGGSPGSTQTGSLGTAPDLSVCPQIDFNKYGETEIRPLSRIGKISAQNLVRNWAMIPAVTFHEEADISELEAFRVQLNKEQKQGGVKLTLLSFLIKATAKALQKFPNFNASLDGDHLILKKYYHIGFAADTPHGLMVPVVKDADKKSVIEIAIEVGTLAKTARGGKLDPSSMQGACFTISSLGGIGGTAFAPIINAPEVAILGVNKAVTKPIWNGNAFVPRLMLPMSLTADHRVVDGVLAARFNLYLARLLADMRRVIV